MRKPYVVILFPDTSPKQAFTLDRAYNYIGDSIEVWGWIKMGNIIETSTDFFPSFDYQSPRWARELKDQGHRHIALWTNYYE